MREIEVAHHFQDAETQTHAARFGIWLFLGSEALLFSGLFTLYAANRTNHPEAFSAGIHHNDAALGTLNTVILICSSFTVAMGVAAAERKKPRTVLACLAMTIVLAMSFLVVKAIEYTAHYRAGLWIGGRGGHHEGGSPSFWTLYYACTGTHGVHVLIGMGILGWLGFRVHKGRASALGIELGALYWHLVDLIWIFLWPLFYLMH